MISFVTPCYNHNSIVHRAIESLLVQQCEKEIILVDDGSDTPVENVWGDEVKLIRHEVNRGLSAALNTGIQASKYDYFAICSSDDMLDRTYGNLMSSYIGKADIISCDFRVPNGRRVITRPGNLNALMESNCHSYAALISKQIWKKCGGYKEKMNPSWEDWEFFLNAAKNGATWFHVPLPLHIYDRAPNGRDAEAQGKDYLLRGKLQGYHQDLYGKGMGLVTFVIPCYNHEKYLCEAIESVLNQKYPHVSVVVVDDGSPGKPESVIPKKKNIILVKQENKHLSGARNTGIKVALDYFNPEYLVMLDADDTVHKDFVEETLSVYQPQRYIYTDIKFIGDANHQYELEDYDCKQLAKKHLHACTFLSSSKMYTSIIQNRGYAYDEKMKEGYEDWEFAVTTVENGYCGFRLPKYLFHYRYHNNGSMRTEAEKKSKQLGNYIRGKHHWMQVPGEIDMGCSTCGGRNKVRVVKTGNTGSVMMNIPGVGEIDGNAPILVTYTGPRKDTIKKIGMGGTIYQYTGNPNGTGSPNSRFTNTFTAFAKDAHLFKGPYKIEKFRLPTEIVEEKKQVIPVLDKNIEVIQYKEDDFNLLDLPENIVNQLKGLGLISFNAIKNASNKTLGSVSGLGPKRIEKLKEKVNELA